MSSPLKLPTWSLYIVLMDSSTEATEILHSFGVYVTFLSEEFMCLKELDKLQGTTAHSIFLLKKKPMNSTNLVGFRQFTRPLSFLSPKWLEISVWLGFSTWKDKVLCALN